MARCTHQQPTTRIEEIDVPLTTLSTARFHGLHVLLLAVTLSVGVGCKGSSKTVPDDQGSLLTTPRDQLPEASAASATFITKANIAIEARDWDKARVAYDQAIQADPNNWELYMDRAIMESKNRDFRTALATMRSAMEMGGERDWLAWYNLGNIYTNRGMYTEASTAYRVSLGLQDAPHMETLLNLSGAYIFLFKFDDARATLDHMLTITPSDHRIIHNHAMIFHLEQRYDEALAGYDSALELEPTFAQSHFNRADVLSKLKRPEDARAAYQDYLEHEPAGAYAKRARNRIEMLTQTINK